MTKYLHTMIRVSSLEDTIAFFEVLGLREIRRRPDEKGRYTNVFLAAPGGEGADDRAKPRVYPTDPLRLSRQEEAPTRTEPDQSLVKRFGVRLVVRSEANARGGSQVHQRQGGHGGVCKDRAAERKQSE